jgi:hypothetical protein
MIDRTGPRRRSFELPGHDRSADPAVEALTQLIESERDRALQEEPELAATQDPGQLWLQWFAIGATFEVCALLERHADEYRDQVLRQVGALVFGDDIQSDVDPARAEPHLRELFESAGADAVQACMQGDGGMGHYLAGLRASADRGTRSSSN